MSGTSDPQKDTLSSTQSQGEGSLHDGGGPGSPDAPGLGPWGRWSPGKPPSEYLLSTYWPPKSCIPRRANTTMNRKSRNSRLMMDFMELRRETTRFLRDAQYLPTGAGGGGGCG